MGWANGTRWIEVGGRPVEVRIRASARARRSRIVIGPRRPLEVVVPRWAGPAEVDHLLRDKLPWIEAKLAWARTVAARQPVLGLDRPGVVWLGGEPVPLVARGGARAIARRSARPGSPLVATGRDRDAIVDAVLRWYRREARRVIEAAVARQATALGVLPRKVSIRDQRTRWGSCSRDGSLSFSWRLLLAPPEILDYVVAHELCHMIVLSHSKRFWRTLEQVRPAWRGQAAWLGEFGQELLDHRPRPQTFDITSSANRSSPSRRPTGSNAGGGMVNRDTPISA